jgi:hypothetical protein
MARQKRRREKEGEKNDVTTKAVVGNERAERVG